MTDQTIDDISRHVDDCVQGGHGENHDKAESILRRGWSVQGVEEKEVMRERLCDLYRETGREEEAQALEAETNDRGRRK